MNGAHIVEVLSAGSTVAVAIFAGVELWREHQRNQRSSKAAHARASSLAYMLRRRIRTALGPVPDSEDTVEEWVRSSQNAGRLETEFRSIENDVSEIGAIASETPERVGAAVREATVLCLEGVRRLAEYATTERPDDEDIWTWMQMRRDAANDFRECVKVLEGDVIDPALIRVEFALKAKRESEEPFRELASALIKQVESEDRKRD